MSLEVTDIERFPHKESEISVSVKGNVVYTEINRRANTCSKYTYFCSKIKEFHNTLSNNRMELLTHLNVYTETNRFFKMKTILIIITIIYYILQIRHVITLILVTLG